MIYIFYMGVGQSGRDSVSEEFHILVPRMLMGKTYPQKGGKG